MDPLTLRKGVYDFVANVCVKCNDIAGIPANVHSISSEGCKCPHYILIG